VIILDTNVTSELTKPRPERSVVLWADEQPAETLYATAISEAEMLHGVSLMEAGRRRNDLRRAVLFVFAVLLAGRVLLFDSAAAAEYADWAADRRRNGKQVGMADLQIVAIAQARGAKAIATRNTKDFVDCGVALINPWQTPALP
jgi:predicted nucleic acid-binding protein